MRLLSWKPKFDIDTDEKSVEDGPIMHRYRPVQRQTRALSDLIVETSSIEDEYIKYRMENNGYLDFLRDVVPYTIDREESEFAELKVTESKGWGSDNEVPWKKKSKLSDEIEMLEKNELVDWVIGEALALACLHPVVYKRVNLSRGFPNPSDLIEISSEDSDVEFVARISEGNGWMEKEDIEQDIGILIILILIIMNDL